MSCVVCGATLPPLAVAHNDPYCSRECVEQSLGFRSAPAVKPKVPERKPSKSSDVVAAQIRSLGFEYSKKYCVAECPKCGVEVAGDQDTILGEVIAQIKRCGCKPVARDTGRKRNRRDLL